MLEKQLHDRIIMERCTNLPRLSVYVCVLVSIQRLVGIDVARCCSFQAPLYVSQECHYSKGHRAASISSTANIQTLSADHSTS